MGGLLPDVAAALMTALGQDAGVKAAMTGGRAGAIPRLLTDAQAQVPWPYVAIEEAGIEPMAMLDGQVAKVRLDLIGRTERGQQDQARALVSALSQAVMGEALRTRLTTSLLAGPVPRQVISLCLSFADQMAGTDRLGPLIKARLKLTIKDVSTGGGT